MEGPRHEPEPPFAIKVLPQHATADAERRLRFQRKAKATAALQHPNIAFIYEWTLLAEQLGIDLFGVIDSIRVRQGTHDNIRFPGFGVGGYCLCDILDGQLQAAAGGHHALSRR